MWLQLDCRCGVLTVLLDAAGILLAAYPCHRTPHGNPQPAAMHTAQRVCSRITPTALLQSFIK